MRGERCSKTNVGEKPKSTITQKKGNNTVTYIRKWLKYL